MLSKIILKRGREKSLLRRHPWVFSGAVDRIEGNPGPGDSADVCASDGSFLARAAFSPRSQITGRVWSFDPDESIDADFFTRRIAASVARRETPGGIPPRSARRLVFSESDGLPGLIVDRYADTWVCQFLSAGAERWKQEIVDTIALQPEILSVYERSDTDARQKEGLEFRTGLLWGKPVEGPIEISEGNLRYFVDVQNGHKTGFYLDQRENRAAMTASSTDTVLNGFAYTGGFGVAALAAGAARVTHVDASAESLALARHNTVLNGLDMSKSEFIQGDLFALLRQYRETGRRFNRIVLDPPKFAASKAALPTACRGYKDVNMLAFQLLAPGGFLYTFSCSGQLSEELFQKVVADAALDAGRDARILRRFGQADDHPVALPFPESGYLKGLLIQAD
jgi:23S rRNA (cytosine1962-C5)-methyltransferase